ncbi:MAG: phospho-N-acetylmuramoyl-pentapeptide-transferase [Alphaproteobacteria bacterium]|nr:phospho-N-acetylmuramoyl-pentapeptide-transferase [Alphaproteobacteria bacterium]
MLEWLASYLGWIKLDGLGVRSCCAFITALIMTLCLGPRVIRWLKKKQKDGQPIRECGPETHMVKKGTPTMGGIMILLAVTSTTLLWANLGNLYVWILLGVFLSFGLIGGMDDYLKLTSHSSKGITGKKRLLIEFGIALVAILLMLYLIDSGTGTTLSIPFWGNVILNLGLFYIPFAMVVIVGCTNSVNLTDGLDGLVTLPVIMCTIVFMAIAGLCGDSLMASALNMLVVPSVEELMPVCAAVIGSLLGFLWFNAHPADVFMGDTGSLALGGFLGTMAVATKHEVVLAIAGAIFVVEALSDIIQVGSYKMRKKRVFLMAPIHHHFEKLGWPETRVVTRFWIISITLAIVALMMVVFE